MGSAEAGSTRVRLNGTGSREARLHLPYLPHQPYARPAVTFPHADFLGCHGSRRILSARGAADARHARALGPIQRRADGGAPERRDAHDVRRAAGGAEEHAAALLAGEEAGHLRAAVSEGRANGAGAARALRGRRTRDGAGRCFERWRNVWRRSRQPMRGPRIPRSARSRTPTGVRSRTGTRIIT